MNIKFCGASERVTGSNYYIETKDSKFIVDCGLFQGNRDSEKLNWADLPYNPKELDYVIITHSHIDHIGRLPLLYKKGFRGKIYSTEPTKEFAKIFLLDTVNIIAGLANELGMEKLYTEDDVLKVVELFETYDYYEQISLKNGDSIKFYDAGHILGSAIIEIIAENKTLIFSGDLGNPPVPILRDTDFIKKADYVFLESTYGDRTHESGTERQLRLERIIESSVKKNGTLLIPAFAMERTQEILYEISELISKNRVSEIPVYLDSPLAIKATKIYSQFPEYFDTEAKKLVLEKKDLFNFPGLKIVESIEESKAIDETNGTKIIIAGSGMSTGGRILYHERKYLSDPNTTLLIIGFQVNGTIGRALKEKVKAIEILGSRIEVNATIEIIESYSAHADQPKLLYWLSQIEKPLKKVFLIHGEPQSEDTLMHKIQEEQGLETYIPKYLETVEL